MTEALVLSTMATLVCLLLSILMLGIVAGIIIFILKKMDRKKMINNYIKNPFL